MDPSIRSDAFLLLFNYLFGVPVVGLLGFGIGDLCRHVVPAVRLLLAGVGHHLVVDPLGRFGNLWVLDLLGGEEIKSVL